MTGAYLGTPLSLAATRSGLVDQPQAARHAGPERQAQRLRDLVGGAWPAVIALFLVALLQNVDVILVKRQIGGEAAGAYAAAAVAAKAVVWVAIGIGLYLLPEATRAARHGEDPRPVLVRALAVVAAVAVPMLIIYGLFPETVLRLAFGPETVVALDALFVLACAMTLLAIGYLGVQYMLALGRVAFLPALGVVAVAEIALLGGSGRSRCSCSRLVLGLQAAAALRCWRSGCSRAGARRPRGTTRSPDRGLADRGAGARLRACALACGRRRGRGDRVVPRALDGRAGVGGRRGRSRSTRTRAATAGRRRSRRTRRAAMRPRAFLANLAAAGVAERVRHVRKFSSDALGDVVGTALAAVRRRRAPLRPGAGGPGRLGPPRGPRRHDARARRVLLDRRHAGAAVRLRRLARAGATSGGPAASPSTRGGSRRTGGRAIVLRHLAELPWFARNVAIKALVLAGRRRWAERIGLDPAAPWPY